MSVAIISARQNKICVKAAGTVLERATAQKLGLPCGLPLSGTMRHLGAMAGHRVRKLLGDMPYAWRSPSETIIGRHRQASVKAATRPRGKGAFDP